MGPLPRVGVAPKALHEPRQERQHPEREHRAPVPPRRAHAPVPEALAVRAPGEPEVREREDQAAKLIAGDSEVQRD